MLESCLLTVAWLGKRASILRAFTGVEEYWPVITPWIGTAAIPALRSPCWTLDCQVHSGLQSAWQHSIIVTELSVEVMRDFGHAYLPHVYDQISFSASLGHHVQSLKSLQPLQSLALPVTEVLEATYL